MADPRRAITIVPTFAATQAEPGSGLPSYRQHLDRPGLYRWAPGSVLTADGVAVVAGTGGELGNWILVAASDKGADLTDASATIYVGGGRWRVLPAATLSTNRTLTLGTTNAAAGYRLEVTRLDVGAFTLAIVNGGAGAGTLITLPVSARAFAKFFFDGTNWLLRQAGQMPS